MFSLAEDPRALEAKLTELGNVAVVVIDPISAYLDKADSHKNAEVRALLAPLGELAARHNVAIIAISHLNKAGGARALVRIIDSVAFVATARATYLVAADPVDKDRHLFLATKINLAKKAEGLACRIEGATASSPVGPIQTSRVMWECTPVTITADEAVQSDATKGKCTAVDEAKDWLREILAGRPLPAESVIDMAKGEGIAETTLRRARKKLGIKPAKDGFQGPWVWSLGSKKVKNAKDGLHTEMTTFGKSDRLWDPKEPFSASACASHLAGVRQRPWRCWGRRFLNPPAQPIPTSCRSRKPSGRP